MSRPWSTLRSRLRHPSYVDMLYRARCECGWSGPIREDEWDAQADRSTHWEHAKVARPGCRESAS